MSNKCLNYELCETDDLPDIWIEFKGRWLCTGCDIAFGSWKDGKGKGVLTFTQSECPICLTESRCVSQPRCGHVTCISCFKRCYYGDREPEPEFPYPEIEEEYFDDTSLAKWQNYPLISRYNKDCDRWERQRDIKYELEENLRKCPICRQ